ncbi:energy transducer TonB [Dyella sp.]|uniref:energy transducer TonB family protein n=1 Tax=Dyella sp. TaxID=1869338 RepID=UPI002D79412E|nr:energy transducer TonB [Dyella sp.]HET7329427.1 energy transducer TonB [Dyella sp.]
MPRLRVTASLSLLALVIGVGGVQWLSEQTYAHVDWPVAVHRPVTTQWVRRAEHPRRVARVVRPRYEASQAEAVAAPVAPSSSAPTLVPVSTPAASLPTSQMEDHAVGNVVLHLTVDGQGEVTHAAIAQSSGDSVLDSNALAIAQRWRFAVPADHPQGISGDLPMRFDGHM